MRKPQLSNRFKRDFRREEKGRHRKTLSAELNAVISYLAADLPLPASYRDHALVGNWRHHRECHIKPDLLLIYQKPDPHTLILMRLGSHSELELS